MRNDNMLDGTDNLRSKYMRSEISHQAYNMAIAEILGIDSLRWTVRSIAHSASHCVILPLFPLAIVAPNESGMPYLRKCFDADQHLNNIPLRYWDRASYSVGILVRQAHFAAWSLSDTVCVLKAVARDMVEGC